MSNSLFTFSGLVDSRCVNFLCICTCLRSVHVLLCVRSLLDFVVLKRCGVLHHDYD